MDKKKEPIKHYVVDEIGDSSHKDIASAMEDAAKHPNRRTMIRIHPNITIENFGGDDDPRGDV